MGWIAQGLELWRRDDVLRHGALLFIAAQFGAVCNLVFQVLVMRSLPGPEYAVLAAVYSVYLVAQMPLDALRTVVAHDVAERAAQGMPWRPCVWRWTGRLGLAGVGVFVAAWAAQGPARAFFHMEQPGPLRIMALILALAMLYPATIGGLQGIQAFGRLAVTGQAFGVVRLAAAWILLAGVGATADLMLWAQLAGVAASVLLPGLALARLRPHPVTREETPAAGSGYVLHALVGLGGFSILMNADMGLAKHLFADETAGTFARAATIGRALVFLPMPVAMALFPKIVNSAAGEAQARRALGRALVYTLALVGGLALALTAGLPWIWRLFTGEALAGSARAMALALLWAFVPLAPVHTMINYALARRRFRAGAWAAVASAVYLGLVLTLGARGPLVIPAALGGVSVLLLGVLAADHLRSAPRP